MPLLPGKKNVGKNIEELMHPSKHAPHGRSRRQAIAIALKHLRAEGDGEYTRAYHRRKGHRGSV
jgi:hypothetical protein